MMAMGLLYLSSELTFLGCFHVLDPFGTHVVPHLKYAPKVWAPKKCLNHDCGLSPTDKSWSLEDQGFLKLDKK